MKEITREEFDSFLPEYPDLDFEKKLALYCQKVFKYEFPNWRKNLHNGNYIVYDKYYRSLSNPRIMQWYLKILAEYEKAYPNLANYF